LRPFAAIKGFHHSCILRISRLTMNPPVEIAKPALTAAPQPSALLRLALFAGLLTLCFSNPLLGLVKHALKNELHSHALLIPFISAYLIWLKRDSLKMAFNSLSSTEGGEGRGEEARRIVGWPTLLFLCLGLIALAIRFLPAMRNAPAVDKLTCTIFAFVSFLIAGAVAFIGNKNAKLLCFPLLFLYWLVPFPVVLVDAIETFFQTTSAYAAHALFSLAGTPVLKDGMIFRLPGLTIRVAQECSGIRSSLVLFITALLAGYMFLQSPWKRGLLALFVIPLGIVRNAFRIFAIAMLTIEVDPEIINSALHHRGGPIFFALSLIPFFAILFLLRRSERPRSSRGNEAPIES
jgi:exosortase C (VPDSG-CTERM-specific)